MLQTDELATNSEDEMGEQSCRMQPNSLRTRMWGPWEVRGDEPAKLRATLVAAAVKRMGELESAAPEASKVVESLPHERSDAAMRCADDADTGDQVVTDLAASRARRASISKSRAPSDTRGSRVSPRAMDESVAGCAPDSAPISAQVYRFRNRKISADQLTETSGDVSIVDGSLWKSQSFSQWKSTTFASQGGKSINGIQQNAPMRDLETENELRKPGVLPGRRVRYWREQQKLSRDRLGEMVGCSGPSLADLEAGRTKKGKLLPEIARALKLSYDYLLTGKGDHLPKAVDTVSPASQQEAWPLPVVARSRIDRLLPHEREYVGMKLAALLDEIESERRVRRSS